jgi:serine/threonine protein kinase
LNNLKAFGLPEMKEFGRNNQYNILVMELLGPSLESLFQYKDRQFSLKTTMMIGLQMIDRIEYVHSRKIIHRDIKPDNFAIGEDDNSHIIYILDFGLAKKYWSSTNKCHIPFIKGKKLTGTARYSSVNALSGCEQSRRDDLESIAYLIIYFLRGRLPWQGIKVKNKEERYAKILKKKKSTTTKELCIGVPKELELFVNYAKNLDFEEVPDYNYLKQLLKSIIMKNKICVDYFYDWDDEKPNIDSNNKIFKNNYNIEYNGKKEWLIRTKDKNNIINTNNSSRNSNTIITIKKNEVNVCPKPTINKIDYNSYKNQRKNVYSANINFYNYKTIENSNSVSNLNSTNYSSGKKMNYNKYK